LDRHVDLVHEIGQFERNDHAPLQYAYTGEYDAGVTAAFVSAHSKMNYEDNKELASIPPDFLSFRLKEYSFFLGAPVR